MARAAPRRPRPRRRRRRRAERSAVLHPAGHPRRRSSSWCTTCTASSGRSSTPGCRAGSAGGSSAGSRRGSTAAASTSRSPGPPGPSSASSASTARRIAVVHNGTDPRRPGRAGQGRRPDVCRRRPAGAAQAGRARHRRRRSRCAREFPGLRLDVVGSGWWEADAARVRRRARRRRHRGLRGPRRRGAQARVYERAWVLALPSLKEGWGLVVGEAGMHGTPTVAYRVGRRHARVDRRRRVRAARRRPGGVHRRGRGAARRRRAAGAARRRARGDEPRFTWEHAQESFALVVQRRWAAAHRQPGPGGAGTAPDGRPRASRSARSLP